jgi:hypothetical protein
LLGLTSCKVGWVPMTQPGDSSSASAAILAQFPGPLILHQTKFTWLVLLALPLAPVVYLFVKFWPLLADMTAKGWLAFGGPILAVWASLAVAAAVCITRGLPRLVLDGEGFELQNLLGGYFRRRWRDVAGFSPCLFFVLLRHKTPATSLWTKLNREVFLPAFFGFGTKGLAGVMTAWREQALSQPWAK